LRLWGRSSFAISEGGCAQFANQQGAKVLNALIDANRRVIEGMLARNSEYAEREIGVANRVRRATDNAYRQFVEYINARIVVEETDRYEQFVVWLNALILYYKRHAIRSS
jgi:hypothetical protein